jgi:hypothetical protein
MTPPYAAVTPMFTERVRAGTQPEIFGDGGQTRDFTFVANAVHANLLHSVRFSDPLDTSHGNHTISLWNEVFGHARRCWCIVRKVSLYRLLIFSFFLFLYLFFFRSFFLEGSKGERLYKG